MPNFQHSVQAFHFVTSFEIQKFISNSLLQSMELSTCTARLPAAIRAALSGETADMREMHA